MTGSISIFRALLMRDLTLAVRSGGGWFYAILFFTIFAALAAIAIGPEMSVLGEAAPAVVWLAMAFALQFSAADIFENDYRDGSLRVIAAEQESLAPYFFAKFAFVTMASAAPLIAVSPVILTMLGAPPGNILGAAGLIILGLPAVILMALFTAALATGLRAAGLLATVIAAPFIAPVLIFGVIAVENHLGGASFWSPEALILAAFSLFMAALTPAFSIMALRLSLE